MHFVKAVAIVVAGILAMRVAYAVLFVALCGHTHSEGVATIRDNLKVFTGHAGYGEPIIQRVFDVG